MSLNDSNVKFIKQNFWLSLLTPGLNSGGAHRNSYKLLSESLKEEILRRSKRRRREGVILRTILNKYVVD
jgi:hypothetical protein